MREEHRAREQDEAADWGRVDGLEGEAKNGLCGLVERLVQVARDHCAVELLLVSDDLEPVALELVPARVAVAERLALCN